MRRILLSFAGFILITFLLYSGINYLKNSNSKQINNYSSVNNSFQAPPVSPSKSLNTSISPANEAGTDLSYIMSTANQEVSIILMDKSGKPIAESFLQQSLTDPATKMQAGESLEELLLPSPNTGNYLLTLSPKLEKTTYNLTIYLYDINGKVKLEKFTGLLSSDKNQRFLIYFDKLNVSNNQVTMLPN